MAGKTVSIGLETDGTRFRADIAAARGEIRGMAGDVRRAKAEASGGVLGGLGKRLREEALRERQGGGRQLDQLLAGGTVGMAGGAARAIEEMTQKWREFANELRKGKIDNGEFVEKMIGTLPVMGQMWQAGRNIRSALQDSAAAMAELNGASAQTVDSLKSDVTYLEDATAELEKQVTAIKALNSAKESVNSAANREVLAGGSGLDKIELHYAEQRDQARGAGDKLASELRRSGSSVAAAAKQGEDLRLALVSAAHAEYLADLKKNKAEVDRVLKSRADEAEDLRGSNRVAWLRAAGDADKAHTQEVENNFRKQKRALQDWAETERQLRPQSAGMIRMYVNQLDRLYEHEAILAEEAPLKDAINQINRELKDSSFATAIDQRLSILRAAHADEKQIMKERANLQLIEDRNAAKGMIESTRTPLEKLAKEKKDLDRMLAEGVFKDHPEVYERALGDAAKRAREELGLNGPAKTAAAVERRSSFVNLGTPDVADPTQALVKSSTDTLKESQKQTALLQKIGANVLEVIKVP